jgi:hypothetical protein
MGCFHLVPRPSNLLGMGPAVVVAVVRMLPTRLP